MRLSSPMPRATSCTSAPTASQRSAISLMKVIFIARKALAAYLISSEVRRSVNSIGVSLRIERAIELAITAPRALVLGADDHPVGPLEVVDRRAFAQELRVGDDGELGVGPRSRMIASISSPVPTGTVDLVTTTVKPSSSGGDLFGGGVDVGEVGVAVAAARRRADGDEDGVGLRGSPRRRRRRRTAGPRATLRATSSSRPGS